MTDGFNPALEAGAYTAPAGLYERIRAMPFLGSLHCPRAQLVAGEWTELELTYEVGGVGLADGAGAKLAFKFYSDWDLFQTSDPAAANYVSAEYLPGPLVPGQSPATVQALKVRFDQKGSERPFQKAVVVDVVDGYLVPGDRIVIRLGDRRHGGKGTRVQSFAEAGFRFRLFVDPLGSSKFAEVPGDCVLDIVPGAAARLHLVAPRLAAPDMPLYLTLRADDVWGNTCRDLQRAATVTLTGPGDLVHTLRAEFPAAGWSAVRLSIPPLVQGEWRIDAADAQGTASLRSYLQIEPMQAGTWAFYADLHAHSNDTVGTNDAVYNLGFARDVAALDILGYTVNDFNIAAASWDKAVAAIEQFDEPSRFVCYPGTEWCGNSAAGGDRNVVFLRGAPTRFPLDAQGRSVRSFEWNEAMRGPVRPGTWPVDDLYAAYADDPEGHLLIPHVGGRRCILDWHHPQLERLVEIGSAWGQFHWLYTEALARGWRVGASAASDEHQGRPGGGAPATGVFGARGGLTGVLADRLDRQSVGEALRRRRTFATTGERSYALLRYGKHWMGEDAMAEPGTPLAWRVLGDAGWEEIVLYDADRPVWSRDLRREAGASPHMFQVRFGGARIKDRYRAAYWQGRIEIGNADIVAIGGVGFDHPEQCAWRDGNAVVFTSATHGDTDGVEITLSALAGARIDVHADIFGYTKVGDPLHPPPHAAAPCVDIGCDGAALAAGQAARTDLPGVELHLEIVPGTVAPLSRDLAGVIGLDELALDPDRAHSLFLTARQSDQSRIWTSPVFLRRASMAATHP